jgi:hypothetical protein
MRKLLLVILLFPSIALAQARIEFTGKERITNPSSITVWGGSKVILTITKDGEIIVAEGAPISERAREFIEAVRRIWPETCRGEVKP